ncbi:MAG TPA: hypothetical protein VGQ99_22580 [Tepidisphaeraceae bacterium]|jgi:hypothetical protein|nr:hypothetical protein [Tepidisphaeraceae bacterium]
MRIVLAQTAGPSAATLFYITLLIIFVTAILTTVLAKWSRDKCLKFFKGYRITLERYRGQALWGRLKVFSSGVEIVYDHAYVDPHSRRKTSYLFYQPELETQVLSIFRHHGQLPAQEQARRLSQVHATFNPRFFRRLYRGLRNFVNTLRDAFNAAIGAAVTQYQRTNPVLSTQGGTVTNLGQTLLGKFANAYEPLLEQYIGQPVILEVADPLNPNNAVQEYTGYLADYTQQFIAVFNVDHPDGGTIEVKLPDVEKGDPLPPLPLPPPPGAPAPMLPIALVNENGVEVRMDGVRMKIQNARGELLAVLRLEKEGFDPLELGMVLPPMGTLNLPARDARGGKLVCTILRSVDIVAPRKFATVRHAGELVERRGLSDEFQLERLPLVSRLFGDGQERH